MTDLQIAFMRSLEKQQAFSKSSAVLFGKIKDDSSLSVGQAQLTWARNKGFIDYHDKEGLKYYFLSKEGIKYLNDFVELRSTKECTDEQQCHVSAGGDAEPDMTGSEDPANTDNCLNCTQDSCSSCDEAKPIPYPNTTQMMWPFRGQQTWLSLSSLILMGHCVLTVRNHDRRNQSRAPLSINGRRIHRYPKNRTKNWHSKINHNNTMGIGIMNIRTKKHYIGKPRDLTGNLASANKEIRQLRWLVDKYKELRDRENLTAERALKKCQHDAKWIILFSLYWRTDRVDI